MLYTVLCVGASALTSFTPFSGLVAPVFTPLAADGSLDVAKVASNAAWLNATGVKTVFTAGSTGESVDLTVAERKALAEAWIKAAPTYGMRVIVHVGTDSVTDAIEMAKHAEASGADAVAAMPPVYNRPATVDALVQTMGAVASAAPNTPFYYYHIPQKTFVDFKMSDFVPAADSKIPNLRGIKFTNEWLDDLQLTMAHTFATGPEWRKGTQPNLLFGRDQFLLGAAAYGVTGAVGTTYNFNGELQGKVLERMGRGDLKGAREAQDATARFIKMFEDLAPTIGSAYAWKMAMDLIGQTMGPPRLPYTTPSSDAVHALKSGLLAWCQSTTVELRPSWCARLA
jgi:N-acetylneuraminate lyase